MLYRTKGDLLAPQTPAHNASRLALSGLIVALMLVLVACSGPGGSDNEDPTATAIAEPTAEPTAVATETTTPEPEPTATLEPDPTATATVEPTATATATPEPDPTATPVPPSPTPDIPVPAAGGAAFLIEGKAVTQVIRGNAEGSILYALTDAGISKSIDSGRTWFASGSLPEGEIIVALNNPDVLYAGDRGSCGRGPSETPLTRSTDGGRAWETFAAGEGIQPYLAEAGQQSTVVGSDCGLQISTDGGQSWQRIEDLNGFDFFDAAGSGDTLNAEIVAIGVSEGGTGQLFLVNMGDPASPQVVSAIAEFYAAGAVDWHASRIVLATSAGVSVTDDKGVTWRFSRAGLEDATFSVDPLTEGIPEDESGQNFNVTVATIDPANPDRIWIGGVQGAFLSTDAGATWRRIGDAAETESIVISQAAGRVFVSANGSTRVWTLEGE